MEDAEPDSRDVRLPPDASGRLDSLLSRLLPGVSRRRLKQAFREGRVLCRGRRCRGSDIASPGMEIELRDLPEWSGRAAGAPKGALPDLEIVHVDEDLLVVEKPAGMPSYPREPGEGKSVAEAALSLLPDMAGVGDLPNAPGLCHRLDVETSGLLLFARKPAAFESLRKQFRAREVEKTYLAAAAGRLAGEGKVDVPLGRRSARRMTARPREGDRVWPAVTSWKALSHGPAATLVKLRLETGVTHQARVHLAWLGGPIVGDTLYGGPPAERLYLHASRLCFAHPATAERMDLSSGQDEVIARAVRLFGAETGSRPGATS